MRRLSAASARQVVRAVAVFAVTEPGESGERRGGGERPESLLPSLPQPPARPLSKSRGVERGGQVSLLSPPAWETSQSWRSKNWLRGREGRGKRGGAEKWQLWLNIFKSVFALHKKGNYLTSNSEEKNILTGGKIWVTHPQSQCFFGRQVRKLRSSSQDLEIYFSLSHLTLTPSPSENHKMQALQGDSGTETQSETPQNTTLHHNIWRVHIECFHDRHRANNHFVMQRIQLNIWHRAKYFW